MIQDNNLIFLVSQPRSGSSLLQQCLLGCGEIKSVPETWMLLSLFQVFRPTMNRSEFNPAFSYVNFSEFVEKHGPGISYVKDKLKDLALELYNKAMGQDPGKFFLDKTPRYFHIIPLIREIFPQARIIILLRNPVSVFASILEYNFKGKLDKIFADDRKSDLFTAPKIFSELLLSDDRTNLHFIKYENFIEKPMEELNRIMEFLHLEFRFGDEVRYKVHSDFINSRGIDNKSATSHDFVSRDYISSWKKIINDSEKKNILLSYLKELGPQLINSLGYDFNEAHEDVIRHKVKFRLSAGYSYFKAGNYPVKVADFITSRLSHRINKVLGL